MTRSVRSSAMLLLALLVACDGRSGDARLDPERQLALGVRYGETVLARAQASPSREEVIALGYLERHRLGLGSPFRLIDFALRDVRMSDSTRARLAAALLARTAAGAGYHVDAAALARYSRAGGDSALWWSGTHVARIERAVAGAADPRSGELAVRLAYTLASAERSAPRALAGAAAGVAALVRDRELARADARRLLDEADRTRVAAVRLVPIWRAERRFLVEQPDLAPVDPRAAAAAVELAPLLLAAVRADALAASEARVLRTQPTLLNAPLALRLAAAADSLRTPPSAPVAVTTAAMRAHVAGADADAGARDARRRFTDRATTEESFVAEHVLLAARGALPRGVLAELAWRTAVALRPFAQEEVWLPGMRGAPPAALEERFGLRAVTFGAEVPEAWRPYYRRMLASAFADLTRVLPDVDLRGLRVYIGEAGAVPGTLALHSPRDRTLRLPPRSAAGVLAHELAHDLDWQIARARYGVRGTYATDYARLNSRPLAVLVQELSREPLGYGLALVPDDANRPAEVFARRFDWLVAAALAREGRMNGYLSSHQHDLLPGYAGAAPLELWRSAGAALLSIVEETTRVGADTRRWLESGRGNPAWLPPSELLRLALDPQPAPGPPRAGIDTAAAFAPLADLAPHFDAVRADRDALAAAFFANACTALPAEGFSADAQHRIVAWAATARARRLVIDRAEAAWGAEGRRWAALRLAGERAGPDAPGDAVAFLHTAAEQLAELQHTALATPSPWLLPAPNWEDCATR